MATSAQTDANRRNARLSTGPTSEKGKANASRNAMKFGLYSRHLLLPGEDEQELTKLRDGLYARLKPVGEMEDLYVERIIAAAWRLRRTIAAEGEIARGYSIDNEAAELLASQYPAVDFERVLKQSAALERSMDKAINELKKLQAGRVEEEAEETAEAEVEESSGERAAGKLRVEILKTNPISTPQEVPEQQGGKEETSIRQNEANLQPAGSPGDAGGGAIPAPAPEVT
jgi:hypothetical protein